MRSKSKLHPAFSDKMQSSKIIISRRSTLVSEVDMENVFEQKMTSMHITTTVSMPLKDVWGRAIRRWSTPLVGAWIQVWIYWSHTFIDRFSGYPTPLGNPLCELSERKHHLGPFDLWWKRKEGASDILQIWFFVMVDCFWAFTRNLQLPPIYLPRFWISIL